MPLLKHAKKKLRQDKKRTLRNKKVREHYKEMLKKAKANPSKENLALAFSSIDKAAKENLMHENKAARLKSSLAKVSNGPKETKETNTKGSNGTKESKGSKGDEKVMAKSGKTKTTPKATAKKTTKKAAK